MTDDDVVEVGDDAEKVPAESETVDEASDLDETSADSGQDVVETTPRGFTGRRSLTRLSPVRLATIIGLVAVLGLGGLCGWLGYRAYQARQAEQLRALFVQVGKQGAVNLTTIDFEHADDDVKRILDSATGEFYDDFEKRSGPFIEVVKKTRAKSVGTITEAGLESFNGDEGQVLVAVSVTTTNTASPAPQPPRFWRMRLGIQKFGDEAKVAKVDFVP
jgi:Mce-associated membrane protein